MLLLDILNLFSKISIYMAMAMACGGLFIHFLLQRITNTPQAICWPYIFAGCILGLLALGIDFFMQVGRFAEEGLLGMGNPIYREMLWISSVGESVRLRLLGFFGLMMGSLLLFLKEASCSSKSWRIALTYCLSLFSALLLAYSFTLTGHLSEQAWINHLLLILHVLVTMTWMGSLYPLWKICSVLPVHSTQKIMHRFGVIASVGVATLVGAGFLMAWLLVDNIHNLFYEHYGQLLLLKLSLVACILLLAARHKLNLVPQLQKPGKVYQLQKSIVWEAVMGVSILFSTAILTTLMSPHN